ncbi:MAG: KTSC domain-containing protein [Planctomycetes bacterium]|nr:KTSC domain-containing protein [Planctomycetota bacterium]
MQRTPVTSSNIVSIGYEPSSNTLEVEFKASTYQYFDVPLGVYQEFMGAGSKGQYFAANIKNVYRYVKL